MTCEMAFLEEQRNNRYSMMCVQISGLQASVANLEAQITARDAEIERLKAQLAATVNI